MLRTQDTVFLGVVVNPKLRIPVYVTRRSHTERTVEIWTVSGPATAQRGSNFYVDIGSGYLQENDPTDEYMAATLVSGFPRAHTPGGVKPAGQGFGTSLYTGLLLLTVAADERDLNVPRLGGTGSAICSEAESRSDEATRWWRKAKQLGLTYQETGDTDDDDETETEEDEDVDLTDIINRAGMRRITDQVSSEVEMQSEYRLLRIDGLRGTVERDIPRRQGREIVVDVFTYEKAVKHNLVAVRDVEPGTPAGWKMLPDEALEVHPNVILALNVANEDIQMVAKLARLASEAGASERDLAAFMMRNRYGVDSWKPVAPGFMPDEEPIPPPRRTPPATEKRDLKDRALDMLARAGTARNPPRQAPIAFRRNPPPEPTGSDRRALEQNLTELDKRREDLGWNELGDIG